MELDDQTLTSDGLAPRGGKRILLLACGALAKEILDLINANGWDHMDLQCLPAILHNTPADIPFAVEQAVQRNRSAYDEIFVVYGDCGTGGLLQQKCDELGVTMMPGPHCYAFFDGVERFSGRDEMTSFYLTDFLVRQFETFVWRPLGLDRYPDLRDTYFGNYTQLVYLAQTDDPNLTKVAAQHAEKLGLSFVRRFTGYGDLTERLSALSAPE